MIILWIIPSIALLIGFLYWAAQDRLVYFGYLCIAPAVFAAIAVTIATQVFKLWQWHTSILPQILQVQRPLVYTAYFNLTFVLAGRLLTMPTTPATVIESTLVIEFISMVIGFIHDIFGVDVGLYKIRGRHFDREKYGTIMVVSRYGFYFFGTVGLLLGCAAKIGYYYLYESQSNRYPWWILGLLAGVTASFPILLWGLSRYTIRLKKMAS